MKLKTVVFYQAVKLWDGNSTLTVNEGNNKRLEKVTIDIKDHMITLECPTESEIIVVGTSNMREARYCRQPSSARQATSEEVKEFNNELKNTKISSEDLLTSAKSVVTEKESEDLVAPVPAGFDPSRYAGKQTPAKVTKPVSNKSAKKETK